LQEGFWEEQEVAMTVKIQDLLAGADGEQVNVEGETVPVEIVKELAGDGYEFAKRFPENNQFAFWGKLCSACFTAEQLKAWKRVKEH
jgi:hypothetical protein